MVLLKQQRHFKPIEIVILVSIVVVMVNTIFFKYLCIKLSFYKLSLFYGIQSIVQSSRCYSLC